MKQIQIMSGWEMVGFTASMLSAGTFLPEVSRAIKTQHLGDVAWGMLILIVSNCALWIVYASYLGILPVILSSSLNLIMGIILMSIKWRSERKLVPVLVGDNEKDLK